MPQERPNHYGHLLDRPHLIKSPAFPNVAEAQARRRRARENLSARLLLFGLFISLLYTLISHNPFGLVAAGFFGVGFAVACFIAGSRCNADSRFYRKDD
jgi:hypothetical protein